MPSRYEELRLIVLDEDDTTFFLTLEDGLFNVLGNALANTITGNASDNILNGGAGADSLTGGSGNDTYVVDDAGDVVTELSNEGTDLVRSSVSFTLATVEAAFVENLTLTGDANINGTGNAGNNSLTGNAGANVLTGDAGNDSLDGGAGADSLNGGANNDTYVIDNVGDMITDSEGVDTVITFLSDYTLAVGLENMQAGGTGAINLTGNDANNTLTGNAGANVLNGGAGADYMSGGPGNDTYVVDNTSDYVIEFDDALLPNWWGGGTDKVLTSVNFSLRLDTEIECIMATTNRGLRLSGSFTGNDITGGNGRDVLSGLGGNDALDGGRGRDDLWGGTGRDYFHFNDRPTRSDVDRILDFNARFDTVVLDNAIFTKLGRGNEFNPGKLKSAFFTVGTGARDSNDYLIYNPVTDDLLYDRDGSGRAAAVKIADFNNVRLSAADILII
ncbi:calcium-binding protein [Microvirga terrestris]|uniref:Calcium-binding protein n=1 Tax=Microvirga terrestris TaxID=2791024 RepID=A0ABS0HXF4_9HYPH|nr:calcium-binding protein [Microvirga terrestris]MBF9198186.1 calcium-binding protein [Microvirga terrestris]